MIHTQINLSITVFCNHAFTGYVSKRDLLNIKLVLIMLFCDKRTVQLRSSNIFFTAWAFNYR